jgi:probable HAF family extracellular repeat protein
MLYSGPVLSGPTEIIPMRTSPLPTRLGLTAVLTFAGAAHAQTIHGLGLITGGTTSRGMGVSADGTTVVGDGTVSFTKPFRWTSSGGMTNLGTLGGNNAQASEVSDDGSVVIGYSDTASGTRAFRWTQAGGMVSLGTLTGGAASFGNGVSGDGQAVVGYSGSASGNHAFKWTQADGMIDLGVAPGLTTSLALGANADGSVVVGYSTSPGINRACRWTSTGIENLGVVSGYNNSYGYACSADGSVVVGRVFDVGTGGQIFRWSTTEGIEGLGTLPGDNSAFAYGVSGDGNTIVGMSQFSPPTVQRAFLWTRALGMVDLNTYLPTRGVDLTGWNLTNATDISVDGLKIVGYGIHNGSTEAWIVTLPGAPSCPADLGVGGGVPGHDGQLDNNDFIVFIDYFFAHDPLADRGVTGGVPGTDGAWDNNDFVVFIDQFFAGC